MNRSICLTNMLYCKNLTIKSKNGFMVFGYYNSTYNYSPNGRFYSTQKLDSIKSSNLALASNLNGITENNLYCKLDHVYKNNSYKTYFQFNDNPPPDMYKDMSLMVILRNYLVMELCSIPILVKNAEKLVNLAEKVLGHGLCNKLIKSTVFYQFVGGETIDEGVELLKKLEAKGVSPFLAVPIEELPEAIGESMLTDVCPQSACFDRNIAYIKESLDAYNTHFKGKHHVMNFKLSAFIPIKAMKEFGDKILPKLNLDECNSLPDLKINEHFNKGMSAENRDSILKGLEALDSICKISRDQETKLLIDSEYSMINPTIQTFIKFLAKAYNTNFPTVGATYQCYFKNIFPSFSSDVEFCRKNRLHFICKLVRGAYMEYENARATRYGLPSPICSSYEATCQNYNDLMLYCLEQLNFPTTSSSTRPNWASNEKSFSVTPVDREKFHFMIASHNVETVNLALKKMFEGNVALNDPRISFAQLYGMCDYLTLFLAKNSCEQLLVYKNIPYGPVQSVIPYLLRRARENFSVFARLDAEKLYLRREIKYRLAPWTIPSGGSAANAITSQTKQ